LKDSFPSQGLLFAALQSFFGVEAYNINNMYKRSKGSNSYSTD